MMTRVVVVVNKSWEAEPLIGVLRSTNGRPTPFPEEIAAPSVSVAWSDGTSHQIAARAAFRTKTTSTEVWCLKDLMDPTKSSSSSEEKARVLPALTAAGEAPNLVIAVGTASSPDLRSFNGCVAVGSSCFTFNPYSQSPNPDSNWTDARFGKLIDEEDRTATNSTLTWLDREARPSIETKFVQTPLEPATPPLLIASTTAVALSDVNVTNPDDYVWADAKAVLAFKEAAPDRTVGSMETTHSVIRLCVPSPRFLFVSGITNRLGYFNVEVSPRPYAQNFAASHNAGVTVAWLLSKIMV